MSRPLTTSLSADPRIESLELRRELARTRARWHLAAWVAAVAALGVLQWQVHESFAVLLAIAAAALGVAWDRWQSATADDERIEQDLRALTTVYHESPLTIRKWLTSDFIDQSIRNLLAAALDSEELADGYWKQAVMPFVAESQRGFKSTWRYEIDLIDLVDDVGLEVPGRDDVTLEVASYRRLHSSVVYHQRIPDPAELYYVAIVFEGADLPAWFKKPNFLLREVVVVPRKLIDALPNRVPAALPDRFEPGPATEALDGPYAKVASQVLDARVSIGEEQLAPVSLHVDRSGVSWGFRLSPELQERLRGTAEVRVVLDTFMSRHQHYFPVVMGAPTRHPTVQFNYSLTDIPTVDTEVFFSAERPWDVRLRTKREQLRRVEVMTEPDDWVFTGSGCIFTWAAEPRLALPTAESEGGVPH